MKTHESKLDPDFESQSSVHTSHLISTLDVLSLFCLHGGPVVETPCCQYRGTGLISGWETRFPHAMWYGQKDKKKKKEIRKTEDTNDLILYFYFSLNNNRATSPSE